MSTTTKNSTTPHLQTFIILSNYILGSYETLRDAVDSWKADNAERLSNLEGFGEEGDALSAYEEDNDDDDDFDFETADRDWYERSEEHHAARQVLVEEGAEILECLEQLGVDSAVCCSDIRKLWPDDVEMREVITELGKAKRAVKSRASRVGLTQKAISNELE